MRHSHLLPLAALAACLGCASPAPVQSVGVEGWRQLELRNYQGALSLFEGALASAADAADRAAHHAGRALALERLGRPLEAREAYRAAIELEPSNARWRVGLSVAELALGDTAAAVAACDAALAIDPLLDRAYYNRGCAHLAARRHGAAVDDFSEALRVNPELAPAYNSRGVAHAREGRLGEAIGDFHRAAQLAPLASAHGNCAAAYYAMGDAKLALAELNTAIKLERGNPVHYANRGPIYLDLGRKDLAGADFEEALGIEPTSADVWDLLARARALPSDSDD